MNERQYHYLKVWDYYEKELVLSFFKTLGEQNSFLEFRQHPGVELFLNGLSPIATARDISSQCQIFFHLYQMYLRGEKIFKVEYDLALQLFHTEMRGIKGEHLRAPHKEQYISIPHGFQTIFQNNVGTHAVEGVYVFVNKTGGAEASTEFRILTIGSGNEKSTSRFDDAIAFFRFYIKDSEDVHTVVRRTLADSMNEPESIISDGEYNHDKIPSIVNFVVNTLLYVTTPGADLRWQSWSDIDPKIKKLSGKQLDERKKELRRKHALAGVLGGNLKLRHEERSLYLYQMESKGSPIGVAVLVRGHWRNQWYGSEVEGNRIQRPKWIEPFWKGMNNDIISNKVHILD